MTNTILAFNVTIPQQALHVAEESGVDIIHSDVIYQLLEEFKARKKEYLDSVRNSQTISVRTGYQIVIPTQRRHALRQWLQVTL